MTIRRILSNVIRLAAVAVVAATSAACGGDLLRTGRSPVMLTVESVEITNGATDDAGSFLLSDVQTLVDVQIGGEEVKVPTIFNDVGLATIAVIPKDPETLTSALNSVTITRYRINFRRADGRNAPGVDVPFGWDGGTSVTIAAGSTGEVPFDIVRHSSKSEPPLRQLIGLGGQRFISTIAEITFFGHDQNGNELMVTAFVDVTFSDFADPE